MPCGSVDFEGDSPNKVLIGGGAKQKIVEGKGRQNTGTFTKCTYQVRCVRKLIESSLPIIQNQEACWVDQTRGATPVNGQIIISTDKFHNARSLLHALWYNIKAVVREQLCRSAYCSSGRTGGVPDDAARLRLWRQGLQGRHWRASDCLAAWKPPPVWWHTRVQNRDPGRILSWISLRICFADVHAPWSPDADTGVESRWHSDNGSISSTIGWPQQTRRHVSPRGRR